MTSVDFDDFLELNLFAPDWHGDLGPGGFEGFSGERKKMIPIPSYLGMP